MSAKSRLAAAERAARSAAIQRRAQHDNRPITSVDEAIRLIASGDDPAAIDAALRRRLTADARDDLRAVLAAELARRGEPVEV
jgi:hypothetical protein